MQCEQLTERLADYWAGTLSEADRASVEAHVATCAACRREAAGLGETWRLLGTLPDEEPSPSLEHRFHAMLDAWHEGERAAAAARGRADLDDAGANRDAGTGRSADRGTERDRDRGTEQGAHRAGATEPGGHRGHTVQGANVRTGPWMLRSWHQPAWMATAAALLLVAGFVAGRESPGGAAHHQIGELRGELRGMREMVAIALLTQESAVDRLRGVSWSDQLDRPSDVVLAKLLDTLDHDPNVNVRIAAIDALRKFASEEGVRTGLVQALRQQPSPVVQMALIDAMVELRERRSVDVLRTMVTDQATNKDVRERARRGLQQLS